MKTIAIIGAGAAGLAAAVSAAHQARCCGAAVEVEIIEASDRVGKSILATGNGRCNLSNSSVDSSAYWNPSFVEEVFRVVPPADVHGFFGELGLMMREESEGRMYPLANKASSVLDVLRFAAREAGVRERLGCEAIAVTPVGDSFLLCFEDGRTEYADAVIVACGGSVARSLLPPAYPFAEIRPVLGPLATDTDPLKGLNNIRVRCEVSLYAPNARGASAARSELGTRGTSDARGELDMRGASSTCGASNMSGELDMRGTASPHAWEAGALKAREAGEILFREYGVSGIAAFDLSRFAEAGDVLSIDLVPLATEAALAADLKRRIERSPERSAAELLAGAVLPPVARAVLSSAGIDPDKPLRASFAAKAACALKTFELTVRGIGDARQCQVSRGGFCVEAFDPSTMESRDHPGLFMVGEALDVDAPCGGYNLHWAWASGMLGGRFAVGRVAL